MDFNWSTFIGGLAIALLGWGGLKISRWVTTKKNEENDGDA